LQRVGARRQNRDAAGGMGRLAKSLKFVALVAFDRIANLRVGSQRKD
jgi:hypothetical protein